MRASRSVLFPAVAILMMTTLGGPVSAQETCDPVEPPETEVVADGVTLTWNGSFLCSESSGAFSATVVVTSDPAGADVELTGVALRGTTPRPRGSEPEVSYDASIDELTVTVTGTSDLVRTDEGDKANLHFSISGVAEGERFRLGFNVLLRGAGSVENDGEAEAQTPDPDGPVVSVTHTDDAEGDRPGAEVMMGTDETGRRTITITVRSPVAGGVFPV